MPKPMPRHSSWSQLRASAMHAEFLDAEDERALLARAELGDASAVSRLVMSHMRMVIDLAARYARPGLELDDLVSEGVVGLLEAIRRYDFEPGARLSSYARWWIRAHVQAFARDKGNLVRLPRTRCARRIFRKLNHVEHRLGQQLGRAPREAELAEALAVSELELGSLQAALRSRDVGMADLPREAMPRDRGDDPEQALARQELCSATRAGLRATFAQLSRRERKVFASQFPEPRCTHGELGAQLGVSRQRASQLVAGVTARLREELSRVAS